MQAQSRYPVWLWLNLLSLDAALIAVLWQDFLGRCYPSLLREPGRWTLGLTVWAIYILDRVLDARNENEAESARRRQFYREHGGLAKAALVLVATADALLALTALRAPVFLNGLLIALAAGLYLAVFSVLRVHRGYLKQVASACVFTAGVFLVAWTGTGRPVEVPREAAVAFALLCLGNLLLVESNEKGRTVPLLWPGLALLSVGCWVSSSDAFFRAVSLSAAGLALLEGLRGRIAVQRELRGVLADVALLSPLMFWAAL